MRSQEINTAAQTSSSFAEEARQRLGFGYEAFHLLQPEGLWLTQALMAELFQTTLQNINLHLQNIYEEGELDPGATIKSYLIVRTEGTRRVRRTVQHYSLDAILAVGFRVRSHRGTQFRKWANARLSEYLVKGFTMDDERLKNPPGPGHTDYFDERRLPARHRALAAVLRGGAEQGALGRARAHGRRDRPRARRR